MTSLGSRAARGAAVTLAGQAARVTLQILSVVLLSRLLSPHDYGLLVYVTVVIGFGEIFRDFGLSSAAVQAPQLSVAERTNLFWANSAIGAVLGLVLFAGAEPLAEILDKPELAAIARVMAIVFLINGLMTQFRANLMRDLRFSVIAASDVAAAALALGAALVFALSGWGVWALVGQQLIQAGAVMIMLMVRGRWIPGLPKRRVSIRRFASFGGNIVLSQLVNYASGNIDNVIIGLQHGTNALGTYNRAYQLIMTPLAQIQTPLTTVALPVMSRVQNDDEQFGRFAMRGQIAMGYSIALGLGVVCGLADPLVDLMLGRQWQEAVPLVQLLAIAGIARTLAFVGYWVYLAKGLTKQLFRYSLVTGLIRVCCVLIGSQFGVIGVAAAMAVAPLISWPLSIFWLSRLTPIPTRGLYAGASRVLLSSAIVGGGAWGAIQIADFSGVAALLMGLLGAAVAFSVAMVVRPVRNDVRALLQVVRMVLRRAA